MLEQNESNTENKENVSKVLDIKASDWHKLKDYNNSIVLFWANGCQACEQAKPVLEFLSNKYNNLGFFKIEFNEESFPLYSLLASKIQEEKVVKDENDKVMKDEEGKVITEKVFEDGKPVMVPKIVIPNLFFFRKKYVTEKNELGYTGHAEGANPQAWEAIFDTLEFN